MNINITQQIGIYIKLHIFSRSFYPKRLTRSTFTQIKYRYKSVKNPFLIVLLL